MDYSGSMGSRVKFSLDDFKLELLHVLWEIIVTADTDVGKPSDGFCG